MVLAPKIIQNKDIKIKNKIRKSKSISKKKDFIIGLVIIPEIWEAKELIWNAHISHRFIWKQFQHIMKCWMQNTNGTIGLTILEDFYFKCQVCELRISMLRKNAVIKYIDSFIPKDRYQPDTVQLFKHVMWNGFNYIFIMVYHLTKYGWIIRLKDKKAKNVLDAFKKCTTIHNVSTTLQTDNWREFKNNIMNQFWFKINIQHIFGTPYYLQHQGAIEALCRTIQDF